MRELNREDISSVIAWIESKCKNTNKDTSIAFQIYGEAYDEHRKKHGSFKHLINGSIYEKRMKERFEYQLQQVTMYLKG